MTPPTDASDPQRTCAACRRSAPADTLLRFVLQPGTDLLFVDPFQKIPGRGAYTCPSLACVKQALKSGFARSFQQAVQGHLPTLLQQIVASSIKRITHLISLSRRSGQLMLGHSQVELALRQNQGELLLLASDASLGVQRKFQQWAERLQIPTRHLMSKDSLGHLIGRPTCSLLLVLEAGFARPLQAEIDRHDLWFPHTLDPPLSPTEPRSPS